MEDRQKSKAELLMDLTEKQIILPAESPLTGPGRKAKKAAVGVVDRELVGPAFAEGTESPVISSLFTRDVTTSGSFHAGGIKISLFGRLMEALPLPGFVVDRSGQMIILNQACGRISPEYEAVRGRLFCDLFHKPEAAARVRALSEQVLTTRVPRSFQARMTIGKGTVWCRLNFRSVRIGHDRLVLVLAEDLTLEKKQLELNQRYSKELKREIDRRKASENALRQAEQRLELALRAAETCFWDWNVLSGRLTLDKRLAEILGYSPKEIEPHIRSLGKLVHPEDAPSYVKALQHDFTAPAPLFEVEQRFRCKSGDWKWILTRGTVVERDPQGRPLRVVGTNVDVTERKLSEAKIQALMQATIQSQEKERERISLDLHDQVAQDLSALRLALETVFDDVSGVALELRKRISVISKRVQEIVKTVRDISYDLRPAGLDRLGLESTVRQYCAEFSISYPIKVEFFPIGMDGLRLDFDTEINLFRVIQESLRNAKKHSSATEATVRLARSSTHITLRVRDNGQGFDVKKATGGSIADKKMGLWSMKQRVGFLRGRMSINSIPNQGTEIVVEVPYLGGRDGQQETDIDS